ncbi:RNA polymerase sigma factor [Streptomyces sp. NRRL S-87]|uniref:RNA polymerase sigma factor n=1 Tax=Streptomyces sp. NRRL S-87 TaxID=1463920 RepID=UPI00068DDECD|nr:sigma-70 family RNA polymerase sigma factor [Streptomyces sp. NRRL S-87]
MGRGGRRKWEPPRGTPEANALAECLRTWVDRAGLSVGQVRAGFKEEHFGSAGTPKRTAVYEHFAGIGVSWEFVEAVADAVTRSATDLQGLLAEARPLWQAAVAAEGVRETGPAPSLDELGLRIMELSERLLKREQELAAYRQERERVGSLVWLLVTTCELIEAQVTAERSARFRSGPPEREAGGRPVAELDRLAELLLEWAARLALMARELALPEGTGHDEPAPDGGVDPRSPVPDALALAIARLDRVLTGEALHRRLPQGPAGRYGEPPAHHRRDAGSETAATPAGSPSGPAPTALMQQGSAESLAFWAFHGKSLHTYLRYAYLQLGSDADAEEAVDRAFDSVMQAWPRMLTMERPEAYAWAILKHRIADQQRGRKRNPQPMDIAAFDTAAAAVGQDPYEVLADRIQFYAAVGRLSERQRDAVVLRYGLDLTTRDTARLMGVEEASVRSLLRLARTRLADLLHVSEGDVPQPG